MPSVLPLAVTRPARSFSIKQTSWSVTRRPPSMGVVVHESSFSGNLLWALCEPCEAVPAFASPEALLGAPFQRRDVCFSSHVARVPLSSREHCQPLVTGQRSSLNSGAFLISSRGTSVFPYSSQHSVPSRGCLLVHAGGTSLENCRSREAGPRWRFSKG